MHAKIHTPPPRPNFVPFAIFELRLFFQKSAPNDLDMFKVKNTNIHAIYMYTDKGQIFVSFALQWAVLELRPNFQKSAPNEPNDLGMFKVKNTNYMHPTRPKFLYVSLYDEPFLSYGPIFGKVHRMTLNDPDMFKVKNTNMYGTYTPEAQSFVCFALRWAVFELHPNFEKSVLNDLKMTLTCSRSKQHICIHSRGPNFIPFRSIWWAVFEKIDIFEFPIGHNVKIESLITLNKLKIL